MREEERKVGLSNGRQEEEMEEGIKDRRREVVRGRGVEN